MTLHSVSPLVVLDLGVSALTPKAQSVLSGQEQRFHKRFVMVLSENMRNMQKRDSKHEPKTKGSYKIRQVMKIMEYTHICVHP